MLALKPFTEDHGRSMVLPFVTGGSHLSGSLRLNGFAAHRLAYMLDSLVRVSRRVGWRAQYASVPSAQVPPRRPAERIRRALRPSATATPSAPRARGAPLGAPPTEFGAPVVPRPPQRHRRATKPALVPPRWPMLTS